MFLRRWPLLLFLLALGVLPVNAQNTPNRRAIFSIGGSVRDNINHRALESIQVILKAASGIPVNTTFTRDNGDFQFDGLGNGSYIIEINVKDYDRFQQEVTISGASRLGLAIFLGRPAKAPSPGMQTFDLSPSAQRPAQSP